jgi:hypothetical protein
MADPNKSESAPATVPPPWATGVVPVSEIGGEDAAETVFLLDLAEKARNYITSFPWCRSICEMYFGDGIGKIVGLFLCRIVPAKPDVDEWLWVVVGDLPPAYLVTDWCKNPAEAFDGYVEEMSKWIELAAKGESSVGVIPVSVPATPEWAEDVRRRLDLLGKIFRPWLSGPPIKRT